MKIADVLKVLESRAPTSAAESWDNVGLLAGDPDWECSKVVVDVDLTRAAIEKAKQIGAQLIVVHHPPIFRGIHKLVATHSEALSQLLLEAIGLKIGIAACHTNFDQCALEVAEQVAAGLGLRPKGRMLDQSAEGPLAVKLVVFVPESHFEPVRKALCDAGAGAVGWYDNCTFATPGEGTFRGLENSKPFSGKPHQLEKTPEFRLETMVPKSILPQVLNAMRREHPYEEIAFDVVPVIQNLPSKGLHRGLGYGLIGEFEHPQTFTEFLKNVGRVFNTDGVQVTGSLNNSKVKRVAYISGKGSSFVGPALKAKCDVFVVGEIDYHEALHAARSGLVVVELGHVQSEKFFASTISGWIAAADFQTLCLSERPQRFMSIKA